MRRLLLCAMLLAGCGQSGDLYLPDPPPQPVETAQPQLPQVVPPAPPEGAPAAEAADGVRSTGAPVDPAAVRDAQDDDDE